MRPREVGDESELKLFSCQVCAQILYFENTRCERCFHALGYWPDDNVLSSLEPDGDAFRALGVGGRLFRRCANASYGVCNWLVPADAPDIFCAACAHNLVIPDLSVFDNRVAWSRLEFAKHRLFYTLFRLNLAQTQNMRFAIRSRHGGLWTCTREERELRLRPARLPVTGR